LEGSSHPSRRPYRLDLPAHSLLHIAPQSSTRAFQWRLMHGKKDTLRVPSQANCSPAVRYTDLRVLSWKRESPHLAGGRRGRHEKIYNLHEYVGRPKKGAAGVFVDSPELHAASVGITGLLKSKISAASEILRAARLSSCSPSPFSSMPRRGTQSSAAELSVGGVSSSSRRKRRWR